MERKLTVLAIDDESVVLESIKRHLRKEDFLLHTAETARDGLSLMDMELVDIVLTDLMMPEMDGLELLKAVKARYTHVPVIIITGYATINSALEATNLGAFDYIAKPFTKAELLSVVERAAEVVRATDGKAEMASDATDTPPSEDESHGQYGWRKLQDDGTVLMGVDRAFLESVGKVQNLFLPAVGDQLRQGGVYLRVFSTDMRSHTVLSPLSGTVLEVNEEISAEKLAVCDQPGEKCWLVRLKPSKFDLEIKELGIDVDE